MDNYTSDIWESLKGHVPVIRRGADGKVKEPWMTIEMVNLVKIKEEMYIRFQMMKSHMGFEEYKASSRKNSDGLFEGLLWAMK